MSANKAGWTLGLALGGIAALLGVLFLSRRRPSRGNASVTPGIPDWKPEHAPDEVQPPESAPEAAVGAGAEALPGSEPWMESLRQVMDMSPHEFGYGKSAWTAPLLSRYLQDIRGFEVPMPQVRKALKDLGYQWEHTRYVLAQPAKA